MARKSKASYAITDIILLSRSKKAPEGFNLVGYDYNLNIISFSGKIKYSFFRDLNGLTLCYKTSPQSPVNTSSLPSLTYGYVNMYIIIYTLIVI